jgi:hypothetical protein
VPTSGVASSTRWKAFSSSPLRTRDTYPCAWIPAGHAYEHGELPARSITAFLGTAWGNVMCAARRATRSALNWSGTATVQAVSHFWQPVQVSSSTNRALRVTWARNVPSGDLRIPSTRL